MLRGRLHCGYTHLHGLISTCQILGLLADAFRIRWPSNYGRTLGEVSGFANLNPLALVSLECEFNYDYHASLLQSTLLPLGIVALLIVLHNIFAARSYHTAAATCAVASSAVMLLVFARNTTTLFSAFSCVELKASDDGASTSRLQARYKRYTHYMRYIAIAGPHALHALPALPALRTFCALHTLRAHGACSSRLQTTPSPHPRQPSRPNPICAACMSAAYVQIPRRAKSLLTDPLAPASPLHTCTPSHLLLRRASGWCTPVSVRAMLVSWRVARPTHSSHPAKNACYSHLLFTGGPLDRLPLGHPPRLPDLRRRHDACLPAGGPCRPRAALLSEQERHVTAA